jgi:hypothetical protein
MRFAFLAAPILLSLFAFSAAAAPAQQCIEIEHIHYVPRGSEESDETDQICDSASIPSFPTSIVAVCLGADRKAYQTDRVWCETKPGGKPPTYASCARVKNSNQAPDYPLMPCRGGVDLTELEVADKKRILEGGSGGLESGKPMKRGELRTPPVAAEPNIQSNQKKKKDLPVEPTGESDRGPKRPLDVKPAN